MEFPNSRPTQMKISPIEYQQIGVSIGDVGIWHDGSFDFLFNACCSKTHSINSAYGVPEDFVAFPISSREISKRAYYSPGSIIASAKVSEVTLDIGGSSAIPGFPITLGSSVTFNFHSKDGAILVLPQGASRQNLLPLETFRAHVRKHSAQWYTFARDFLPSTGSLFVVTGCDKTTSWGLATASAASGSVGISLKFTVVGLVESTLEPRYQWKNFGSAMVRTSRTNWPPGTENQCIFIRGFWVPRRIPFLTSAANKILWRGLRTALARRNYDGVTGQSLEAERITNSVSILDGIKMQQANSGARLTSPPDIQILPCD
ncbi:Tkl tkl-ccin protein kinase [Mycena sanguinolenta]|uniref:Tkl tkl-ccin protein kinase n=1 Tax=Mycena sanguinolenta TaxID=230812 RepID=A0A8H6Z3U0_9AGAR|nr:Tkl tkl-ccin protein kinase [Mycena sanguinolenta]